MSFHALRERILTVSDCAGYAHAGQRGDCEEILQGIVKREKARYYVRGGHMLPREERTPQMGRSRTWCVRFSLYVTSLSPILTQDQLECFTSLCTISADTSAVVKTPKVGPCGDVYYTQYFEVVLLCGLTELQAQIRWTQDVCIIIVRFTTHC